MLGWMLVFALLIFSAAITVLEGGFGTVLTLTSTIVFGVLLLISALTLLLRSRA